MDAPLILLAPSLAAAVEWPRRLAARTGAVCGLYPFTPLGLARAMAEPALLGRGLGAWDSGHAALLAARLLSRDSPLPLDARLPLAPIAAALARTLIELRTAGVDSSRIAALADEAFVPERDVARLRGLQQVYAAFDRAVDSGYADPVALFRAARERIDETPWLRGAEVLIVDDVELPGVVRDFLETLAATHPVRVLHRARPPALRRPLLALRGVEEISWAETRLAPLAPPPLPAGLARCTTSLFESTPAASPPTDDSVEWLTAPGEAAETQAIARTLLRAAGRGIPFDEMGILLARPHVYATLFADLFDRIGIPFRLHPSLPLRHGRCARALLLLLRCRGLARAAVMEFLTFAPIPFETMLGNAEPTNPARWDEVSRDAGIVSGRLRWIIGIRAFAESERNHRDPRAHHSERRERRARDAEELLRLVELLGSTHELLEGRASWRDWSERLRGIVDQWIGPEFDRDALLGVITDLAGLERAAGEEASWTEVEAVLEARLEWERIPLRPATTGAVHVGALDALAGVPFRVVAIPGLVEGGFPGVLRPDPFLLDNERAALSGPAPRARDRKHSAQLSLFDIEAETLARDPAGPAPLPTTQDRLVEQRRLFVRAIGQCTERLVLSYPRADPRSGRERMPSLFFAAAASASEGRPLDASDLDRLVQEESGDTLSVGDALDASERDRVRLQVDTEGEAELSIAAGSVFFKRSRLASRARWSDRMTPYDGLVAPLPERLALKLDPIAGGASLSASRLATFSRCGFLYLLQHVLRLEPALEPEERKRLEPLERGSLFHEVVEHFLRALRDEGKLPVRDVPEQRDTLLQMARRGLDALVEGCPPRYTLLWERERKQFEETLRGWLRREAAAANRSTPAYFEVGFGPTARPSPGEPHRAEALEIDLGDERVLRISGKIDRIDRREDGLVLRDYKTGRAPRDDGGLFRGGKQLQIPFYILAAAELFPDEPVVDAFLDYVDGGRQVALDPAAVKRPAFRELLRGITDAIGDGLFLQEPSACEWCDYTAICGPQPLIRRRRQIKIRDARVQRVLRLRDVT
jgi:RecB family exonuclease